jgi:hypothetical protein
MFVRYARGITDTCGHNRIQTDGAVPYGSWRGGISAVPAGSAVARNTATIRRRTASARGDRSDCFTLFVAAHEAARASLAASDRCSAAHHAGASADTVNALWEEMSDEQEIGNEVVDDAAGIRATTDAGLKAKARIVVAQVDRLKWDLPEELAIVHRPGRPEHHGAHSMTVRRRLTRAAGTSDTTAGVPAGSTSSSSPRHPHLGRSRQGRRMVANGRADCRRRAVRGGRGRLPGGAGEAAGLIARYRLAIA